VGFAPACAGAEARAGVGGELETLAEAFADLRAKLVIQAALLRRSVSQRVPFDRDVAIRIWWRRQWRRSRVSRGARLSRDISL